MPLQKTVIASAMGAYARDTQGRLLRVLGNFRPFEGAIAWTDGRNIYNWQAMADTRVPKRQEDSSPGGYLYLQSDGKVYVLDMLGKTKELCNAPPGSYLVLGTSADYSKSYAFLCVETGAGRYSIYNLLEHDAKTGMPICDGSFEYPADTARLLSEYALVQGIDFDATVTDAGEFRAVHFYNGGRLYWASGQFVWYASQYRFFPSGNIWKIGEQDEDIASSLYMRISREGTDAMQSLVQMGYHESPSGLTLMAMAKYGCGSFNAHSILGYFKTEDGKSLPGVQVADAKEYWAMWLWLFAGVSSGSNRFSNEVSFALDDGTTVTVSNSKHARADQDHSLWYWTTQWDKLTMASPSEMPLNAARKPMDSGQKVYMTTKGIYVGGKKIVSDRLIHSKRIEWADGDTITAVRTSINQLMG